MSQRENALNQRETTLNQSDKALQQSPQGIATQGAESELDRRLVQFQEKMTADFEKLATTLTAQLQATRVASSPTPSAQPPGQPSALNPRAGTTISFGSTSLSAPQQFSFQPTRTHNPPFSALQARLGPSRLPRSDIPRTHETSSPQGASGLKRLSDNRISPNRSQRPRSGLEESQALVRYVDKCLFLLL